MSCPTCGSRLTQIPAVYPTWHCGWCGTLLRGSEEDLEVKTAEAWAPLFDSGGECLREDRSQCVLWIVFNAVRERRKAEV